METRKVTKAGYFVPLARYDDLGYFVPLTR
jgi:hypothetical protein